ncbi:Uncharacterized protein DBV15_05190 [Temnothorax longispinosus]|uniref:Uncharacterized protein n=1 Tax=Temnothorax longispinosus TaxID=300112 RepID=A0A4S2KS71_9HYME|nr:Uncharacterized protein DBV15_05190 [Temnothorax longispinosus]
MLIRVEGTIDPRVARKKVGPEEGAHCSEVLKTSIISASNNEGQTSKRIPERGVPKKIPKCGAGLEKGKKDKYEPPISILEFYCPSLFLSLPPLLATEFKKLGKVSTVAVGTLGVCQAAGDESGGPLWRTTRLRCACVHACHRT